VDLRAENGGGDEGEASGLDLLLFGREWLVGAVGVVGCVCWHVGCGGCGIYLVGSR